MKLGLFVISLLTSTFAFAEQRTSVHSGTYSMNVVKLAEMKCSAEDMRQVISSDKKVIVNLCASEYRECMMNGSCFIENKEGQRIAINYSYYDKKAERSYFKKVDLKACSYGYGMGRVDDETIGTTCLIPYFTASTDPLEHKLGDVIFVRSLVGVKLPGGQIHDGYIIVADYAEGYLDTGADMFSLFTGTESDTDPKNAFAKLGFSDYANGFNYEVVSPEKAKEIRAKRGFKILSKSKKKFEIPANPMLQGQ